MHYYKAKSNIFTGWVYPLFVAILVLVGSLTGYEVYTAFANVVVVSIALWASNTIKPFLFFLITFAYQMPKEHLYPSDYYYTGDRPYFLIAGAVILTVSVVAFIIRNGIFLRANIVKIPMFLPLCVLSVGFLLNGLLAPGYTPMNVVWAGLMILVYFLLYLVIYLGIKGEDPKGMVDYFTYITLLTSWILIIQMCKIYFVDGVLVNGEIDRGRIMMGYGVCNLIGFHISTLIPVNFYGFMRGKVPFLSLVTAFALFFANIATTSRNSALVGTIYFIFCLVLCMFEGRKRDESKIIVSVLLVVCGVYAALLHLYWVRPDVMNHEILTKIFAPSKAVLEQYMDRGMDSSGRTDIWKKCVEIFKDNPIFGAGFFGVKVSPQFVPGEFIPEYAHNTIFELIAATGIVGTLCYLFYRLISIKYLLHRFSLDRFMILLGASVLVAESLLDNYVFQIYTTFYYIIAFAIAARLYETQENKECRIKLIGKEGIKF